MKSSRIFIKIVAALAPFLSFQAYSEICVLDAQMVLQEPVVQGYLQKDQEERASLEQEMRSKVEALRKDKDVQKNSQIFQLRLEQLETKEKYTQRLTNLNQKRQEYLRNVQALLNQSVSEVAKEMSLDQNGVVLYAPQVVYRGEKVKDITNAVLIKIRLNAPAFFKNTPEAEKKSMLPQLPQKS